MYRLLLCWRYLRTRFLALACIVSVTLGVATLIVVNSVMAGFSEKLRNNLHSLLADVVVESEGLEGFRDPKGKMNKIMADPFLASKIKAMAASMEGFAMMQYTYPNGEVLTRPVRLMGIDAGTRSELGGFQNYLVLFNHKDPRERRKHSDFTLPPEIEKRWRDHEERELNFRRQQRFNELKQPAIVGLGLPEEPPLPQPPVKPPVDPIVPNLDDPDPLPAPLPAPLPPPKVVDDIKIPRGAVIGNLVAGFRDKEVDPVTGEPKIIHLLHPGDSLVLVTVKGPRLEPAYDRFILVDYIKTDMSEYDGNLVYVDLAYLQDLKATPDTVTHLQIALNDYADAHAVVDRLKELFPLGYRVQTWEQKQGSLLSAIDIEKGILNVLLFMIVAVAGFGILAIFSMIVTEKTRDIGIMKSLGASNAGVMQIFLSYGLLLGLVGATAGTVLGLVMTWNLNPIEKFLTKITGRHIFDPSIYYFNEIPTYVETPTLVLVNLGAISIAVAFSVLPAFRAAMLHPVRALRYE